MSSKECVTAKRKGRRKAVVKIRKERTPRSKTSRRGQTETNRRWSHWVKGRLGLQQLKINTQFCWKCLHLTTLIDWALTSRQELKTNCPGYWERRVKVHPSIVATQRKAELLPHTPLVFCNDRQPTVRFLECQNWKKHQRLTCSLPVGQHKKHLRYIHIDPNQLVQIGYTYLILPCTSHSVQGIQRRNRASRNSTGIVYV